MIELQTIERPDVAAAAIDPLRNRLLAALTEPTSAAGLAAKLGLPRQKVNYHLRELERLGLARVAEQRKWGGLTERLMESTASSYVVSPRALGDLGADPARMRDKLSASYLVAIGARLAGEVSDLARRASSSGKRLATLSIDTVVSFRSPSERAEFTAALTDAITQLVARYHAPDEQGSRPHRVVLGAHPLPNDPPQENE